MLGFVETVLWIFGDVIMQALIPFGVDLVTSIFRWCGRVASLLWNLCKAPFVGLFGQRKRKRGGVVGRQAPAVRPEVVR